MSAPIVLMNAAAADFDQDDNLKLFNGSGTAPIVVVRGTSFGGGTVSLVMRSTEDPLARWEAMADSSFTASGQKTIDPVHAGIQVAAVLTGATSPSGIFVAIHS